MITVNTAGDAGKSKDSIAAERMAAAYAQAIVLGHDEAANLIGALMILPILTDESVIDVFVTLTGSDA